MDGGILYHEDGVLGNPSMRIMYMQMYLTMTVLHEVSPELGLSMLMDLIAVVDLVPITMPWNAHSSKKNSEERNLYDKIRTETDKYIEGYLKFVFEKLENLKYILIYGVEPFKWLSKHADIIPPGVKVFQHSPNMHPSVVTQIGPTIRQCHHIIEAIDKVFAAMLGRSPRKHIMRTDIQRVFMHFREGNESHIYYARYEGVLILIGRNRQDMQQLIRGALVSDEENQYPASFSSAKWKSKEQIKSGDDEFVGLKLELVHVLKHNFSLKFGVQERHGDALKRWKQHVHNTVVAGLCQVGNAIGTRCKDEGERIKEVEIKKAEEQLKDANKAMPASMGNIKVRKRK